MTPPGVDLQLESFLAKEEVGGEVVHCTVLVFDYTLPVKVQKCDKCAYVIPTYEIEKDFPRCSPHPHPHPHPHPQVASQQDRAGQYG